MQAGTALQVRRCLVVAGHVTWELTVTKASLLLLQLAPTVRQASTAQRLASLRVLALIRVPSILTILGVLL
jgi:hypothetical protein